MTFLLDRMSVLKCVLKLRYIEIRITICCKKTGINGTESLDQAKIKILFQIGRKKQINL